MLVKYEVCIRDFMGNKVATAQCRYIADAVDIAKSCGVWADIIDAETGEVLVTYHDNNTEYSIF